MVGKASLILSHTGQGGSLKTPVISPDDNEKFSSVSGRRLRAVQHVGACGAPITELRFHTCTQCARPCCLPHDGSGRKLMGF